MNKRQWNQAIALFVGFIILFLAASSSHVQFLLEKAQNAPPKTALTASFPDSLCFIGDEAFSETSIEVALFNNALQSIGSEAFLNANRLTDAYIPAGTEQIGSNAFPDEVVIHGLEDSYAQTWALQNAHNFIEDDIWNCESGFTALRCSLILALLGTVLPADTCFLEQIRRQIKKYVKSMRPQDRPELYPINYRFP